LSAGPGWVQPGLGQGLGYQARQCCCAGVASRLHAVDDRNAQPPCARMTESPCSVEGEPVVLPRGGEGTLLGHQLRTRPSGKRPRSRVRVPLGPPSLSAHGVELHRVTQPANPLGNPRDARLRPMNPELADRSESLLWVGPSPLCFLRRQRSGDTIELALLLNRKGWGGPWGVLVQGGPRSRPSRPGATRVQHRCNRPMQQIQGAVRVSSADSVPPARATGAATERRRACTRGGAA
jgi:hypothetical protein